MCCFNILVIDHIFTSIRNEVASYGTISSNGINRYHETHSQWNFPSYTSIPSNTSTLGIVVGFPNEHLELKHGDIWINDQIAHIRPFQYVYTKSEPNVLEGYKMKQKYMNMIIPKNTFYILCLDRNAMDSRVVGPIPWTNIKSKVIEHINP